MLPNERKRNAELRRKNSVKCDILLNKFSREAKRRAAERDEAVFRAAKRAEEERRAAEKAERAELERRWEIEA